MWRLADVFTLVGSAVAAWARAVLQAVFGAGGYVITRGGANSSCLYGTPRYSPGETPPDLLGLHA